MMAEIEEEMARAAALAAFLQKLEDEKAAAAASTAAYQAKVAYEKRINKIMDDLLAQLDEFNVSGEYKPSILDELIKEATAKLEDEEFIGTISGEIVTKAIHDYCKVNLGLSDSNIELFKKALAGGYLGNVGPQVRYGTEFTANRWQKYIDCVGSKR
jgi:signal recognition particle GTPase